VETSFEYDEIGYWSEIKLDIIKEYAKKYTTILSNQKGIKQWLYIDAFAGSGMNISKTTGEFVRGSPLNALNVIPSFSEFHLIDMDGVKTAQLRKLAGSRKEVFIYEGDANNILLNDIFPKCIYEDRCRALCLLDPYALSVDWKVIQTAGKMGTIEIFYNFMIMDANMNILWHDPQNVSPAQAERMDNVWGDQTWRNAAYIKQLGLFGDSRDIKKGNEAVAEEFRKRLSKIAGFKYIPKPIHMRNDTGATIYYLYFASPNATGAEIVEYL
jgi:three-Cys-motif partner protein